MIYSSTSRSSRWLGMIQFLKNWYNYYFSIQKMGNIAWNIYYKKKKKKKRKRKTKNKKCLIQNIALGVCIECNEFKIYEKPQKKFLSQAILFMYLYVIILYYDYLLYLSWFWLFSFSEKELVKFLSITAGSSQNNVLLRIYLTKFIICRDVFRISRRSRSDVFCRKGFLEISQNSQENTCARVSF